MTELLAQAVLVGVAAWRLAVMLAEEHGPGDVFERLRRLLGVPEAGYVKGIIPILITCPLCSSVWFSAALWALGRYVTWQAVVVIAAAGVASVVQRTTRG